MLQILTFSGVPLCTFQHHLRVTFTESSQERSTHFRKLFFTENNTLRSLSPSIVLITPSGPVRDPC